MTKENLIILPLHNEREFLKNSIPVLESIHLEPGEDRYDIIVIDDGSTDDTYELIKKHKWLKYIKHDNELGFGASFITAYKYAKDFNYEVMIFLDTSNSSIQRDLEDLMESMQYGYDIVSRSRILENYDYITINKQFINITTEISNSLNSIIEETLTDPLSETKAIRVKSLENLELTEFSHSILLQLWIQSSFYGLNISELPCFEAKHFGQEFEDNEDPLGFYLSVIETEQYLYKKGTIN